MNVRLFLLTLQTAIACIIVTASALLLWNPAGPSSRTDEQAAWSAIPQPSEFDLLPDSVPNPVRGRVLWYKVGCGQCHAANMKNDLTGPALGGVTERWADYPREDLYAWIQQSQRLIDSGHPRAVEVWTQWRPTVMSSYTDLTDEQCADLLAYIDAMYSGPWANRSMI
ncbi:hypothetical protein LEM8419_00814 [Neolewinella maritima]|uniref:Cytochrome c domain-containing protein n=1 Tax=Neolewinella maritima TaxID=1383882 RepID=A0ABM9AXS4_9BACT|nr:cytochrome c [Neolewinella maritima]CAH0999514.1 hypothetical protein LEM8419_00814 [Neolewinella maritima]